MFQVSYFLWILFHYITTNSLYNIFPDFKESVSWSYSFFISTTICICFASNINNIVRINAFTPINDYEIMVFNFYLGYLVVDAWYIWNYCYEESKMYFYHHIVPIISYLFLPLYHFHFIIIGLAESNIPLFCIDMGFAVFIKELKSIDRLPFILQNPIRYMQKNKQKIKIIDAWLYLICRVLGIGTYLAFIIISCGWDCSIIPYWRYNLFGLGTFWLMFVLWCFKMMRRGYKKK